MKKEPQQIMPTTKTKKFDVLVTRTTDESTTITVRAKSENDAITKASDIIDKKEGALEWQHENTDYEYDAE